MRPWAVSRCRVLVRRRGWAAPGASTAVTRARGVEIGGSGLNVRGTLFTGKKALPLFNDGGSIILNASIASSKGFPAFGVYNASKAAVRSFARTWTVDLKARKIRVNALSPGTIETGALADFTQAQKDSFVSLIPRGEIGRPEEIATAAFFLASSDSTFVTGIERFVDGGVGQI